MSKLKSLRNLDASYNQINTIGDILENLMFLGDLNLNGNPQITEMGPRTNRLFQKVNQLPFVMFF